MLSAYLSQGDCLIYADKNTVEGNIQVELCLRISRSLCSGSTFTDQQEKIDKLISAMNQFILSTDSCIIDADNEKTYLTSIQAGENVHLKKEDIYFNGSIPSTKSIGFCTETSSSIIEDQLIDQNEYFSLYDPNLYLAIYAQDSVCVENIPLTAKERAFVNQVRSGEKRIYATVN
ncbi:hypothetical protein [Leptospira licerasiae]|uniref:hypothetical protein n=1 Tax=Leptospira licerasiae TaxID=447106 RepID=UPI001FEF429E|nr:hypothetical protein [Leptospira licerasiae]